MSGDTTTDAVSRALRSAYAAGQQDERERVANVFCGVNRVRRVRAKVI